LGVLIHEIRSIEEQLYIVVVRSRCNILKIPGALFVLLRGETGRRLRDTECIYIVVSAWLDYNTYAPPFQIISYSKILESENIFQI